MKKMKKNKLSAVFGLELFGLCFLQRTTHSPKSGLIVLFLKVPFDEILTIGD